jgi:gliding motility-associated-like protein
VEVGEVLPGVYKNQAQLFGLPVALGETRISDDPRTLAKKDSTSLIIQGVPFDTLEVDRLVCVGESITLDPSFYGVTFEWDDGFTEAVRDVTGAGIYGVNAYSLCDSVYIIYDVGESRIDVEISASETDVILGESVFLTSEVNQSGMQVTYEWIDPFDRQTLDCYPCPRTNALPIDDVTYQLVVTDENGCTAVDDVFIAVDTDVTLYAPNVFSPNGDGVNDVFFLQGKGIGEIYRLDIFNRWGGLVYSANDGFVNDVTVGWNGKIKGEYAEPAVYTWVADIRYINGEQEIISGDVTLLR